MHALASLVAAALLAAAPAPDAAPAPPLPAAGELDPFFRALDAAAHPDEGGVVRVGWWGDSAIVGDGYTGEVRRRLQARFGDAGPGFVLAAPAFDGYVRQGVRMKRQGWEVSSILNGRRRDRLYGYGGVLSSSWGGATTTLTSDGAPFERVLVHYRAEPGNGGLQLFVDGRPEPFATEDTRGEPAEDRVWEVALPTPAAEVKLRASGGGQADVYGLAVERGARGVVLDALGVLGLRARRWDNADPEHVKAQVAQRGLSLVVVDFGGNERVDPGLNADDHAGQIRDTLRLLRAGAPGAACLVVAPTAHGAEGTSSTRLDPALDIIYAAQRRAAAEEGCAFFDTLAAMGGRDAVALFRKRGLLGGDLAHLNGKGHRVVGGLMADWLLAGYDAWKARTASSEGAGRPATP